MVGWIAGLSLMTFCPVLADPPVPTPRGIADRKDALARYGAGIWQMRRERLLSAAKSFEAAARDDPEATEPLKQLLRIYLQMGREVDAARVARTILKRNPEDVEVAHTLSHLLFDAGEMADAVTAAKRAASLVDPAKHPDRAIAIYRDLATLLDRAGDAAAAAKTLTQLIDVLETRRGEVIATKLYSAREIDSENYETLERLGKLLVKQGKGEAAIKAFRAAQKLTTEPKIAARLDWNLSSAYEATKDLARAYLHLEAFLKLRPQSIEPFERVVDLLHKLGRDAEIVSTLRTLVWQDSKNLSILVVLATELARDEATRPQADPHFTLIAASTNDPKIIRAMIRSHIDTARAVRIVAELDDAYREMPAESDGKASAKADFQAEKIQVIAEILRTEPSWANAVLRAGADDLRQGTTRKPKTWFFLASIATFHNKLDLAAVQYRQAIRSTPREDLNARLEAYQQLVSILERSHKPTEVVATCREALREIQAGTDAIFNFHLCMALAELGDSEEAIATADKAIRQSGDYGRLQTRLRKVSVLELLGRAEEAVAFARKMLDEFDTPAERLQIRYTLAQALWRAKRPNESEAEYRAILDTDPDHASAANDLGYHLADQGRNLDEAERLIRHAIAVDRVERRKSGNSELVSAAYLDSLGWVLFRREKLAEARDWLEKSSAMPDGSTDATVWDHLGDVLFRLGEKAKAKAAWDRALTICKDQPIGRQDGRLDDLKRKLKRMP